MKDGNAILLIGRLGNIVLMGLLPIALMAPLAQSEVDLWLYVRREEISIAGSLSALHESGDMLLFYLILCLSVIGPYLRLLMMTYTAFSAPAAAMRMRPLLELVGRFSLIDVIIISLLVISFRVPEFKLQWGFYLVLSLWVLDMLASWSIWNLLRRDAERELRARGDWEEMEPDRPPLRLPDQRAPSPAPVRYRGRGEIEPPADGDGTLADRAAAWAAAAAYKATDGVMSVFASARPGFAPRREASWRPDRSSEPD